MLAAAPVDREDNLTQRRIIIGDDLHDHGAQKLLARPHRHPGRIPGSFQVVCEPNKVGAGCCGGTGRFQRGQPRLTALHALQGCFPVFFELCRDQPIIRIAGSVASFGQRSFVACLLPFQLHHTSTLVL